MGNGSITPDKDGLISIPGLRTTTDVNEFCTFVYPQHQEGIFDTRNRAILSLRNEEVDKFNGERN